MPEFPIHALEGPLTPIIPNVFPKQLLPTARKIHPADLGVMTNRHRSYHQLQFNSFRKNTCKASL